MVCPRRYRSTSCASTKPPAAAQPLRSCRSTIKPRLMHPEAQLLIDDQALAAFCERNHIRLLAFFGSVVGSDFRPDSDVDILVEFEPGHVPGCAFAGLQDELSQMLGRSVDLHTPGSLSRHFREKVQLEAQVHHASATAACCRPAFGACAKRPKKRSHSPLVAIERSLTATRCARLHLCGSWRSLALRPAQSQSQRGSAFSRSAWATTAAACASSRHHVRSTRWRSREFSGACL